MLGLAATLLVGALATLAMAGTTGIISGVVTDMAKGTKLSGVNIVVKGANLTTVTDANGYYVITNVPPGTYEVSASLVGYKDAAKTDAQVVMDATTAINLAMEEAVTQEKEAVVTAEKSLVRPDVAPTLYLATANQEQQTRSQPNSLYQVPGIVLTQPGVVADADGYPHIRGGRSQQIGYMLEGIPIVEPVTNGFGTNLVTIGLSKMQLYTGGIPAEFGNCLSGVINEIKKTGREIRGGGLETLYGSRDYEGVTAEFGDVTVGGLDYYVGAYAWRNDYERFFVTHGDIADVVGKFVYPLDSNDKLTLLLNQGSGKYDMAYTHTIARSSPDPVEEPEESDHGHQGYHIYGLTWSHNFSPSSFLTVRPYMYQNWYIVDALSEPWISGTGFYQNVKCKQQGLQLDYTNQASEKHLIKAGANVIKSSSIFSSYIPYAYLGEYIGAPPDSDYDYTSDVDGLQLGSFIQDQYKLNDKWQVQLGARLDSMKFDKAVNVDIKQTVFSPRFGVTYNPTPRNVWRLTVGRRAMFSPTYLMDRIYVDDWWDENYRTSDPDVNMERCIGIDLGFERQVSDSTVIRVTPFYDSYKDLLESYRPAVGPREYRNLGKGKTTGVEFSAQKKLSNNSEGWLSYTWMRARGDEILTGGGSRSRYLDYDQRNTLSAVAAFHNGPWVHNLQLQFNSGLPFYYADEPTNSRRMGSNTTLNYNITRKLPEGSRLGDAIQLGVFNVFNVGTPTTMDPYGSGPYTWVMPRFFNLSLSRKF